MRFGVRRPSIKGRIAARTSWKRYVRHSMGLKAPRGAGWFTNPKKALYNRVYNRTTVSVDQLFRVPKSRSGSRVSAAPKPLAMMNDNQAPPVEAKVSSQLIGLGLAAFVMALGLQFFGVSVKWSIITPVALFTIIAFGEVIGPLLQFLGILIGLIPALFIGYLFLKIFILH